MKDKVVFASLSSTTPQFLEEIQERFDVRFARTDEEREAVLADPDWLTDATALYCTGSKGIPQGFLEKLPKLSLVCVKGTGYDALDVADLKQRGIAVTHGAGANASSVADQAMALMLATVRHLPQLHEAVHKGEWDSARGLQPTPSRKRLGILGFGTIGAEVAKRAAGFDMPIAYHGRRKRDDVPHTYFATPAELAEWADVLVVSTVGGPGTRHLVDKAVLDALGPKGYLVNVARGSVVDTDALIDALREGRIAGAGLDVVDGEPKVPAALLEQPNLVITPHIGGRSPESADITLELVIDNLKAHFAGKPLVTPIPDPSGSADKAAE